MNYADLKLFDTVNGPGVRVSLFVSGCTLNCSGCWNNEARNFKYGDEFTQVETDKIITALRNSFTEGLSILGGDPCEPKNISKVVELCKQVKEKLPNKTIWVWSGRTEKELKEDTNLVYQELLDTIDVLVDGRYRDWETDRKSVV